MKLESDTKKRKISLTKTKQAWNFESEILKIKPGNKEADGAAKSIANFAINNPAIFAPISMIFAAGINSTGGVISMIINKSNIEAETRKRVLDDIISLDESSFEDLNWAQCLEINHYITWFIEELKSRHKLIELIDLEICEPAEAAAISETAKKYNSLIEELIAFREEIANELTYWEKKSQDEIEKLKPIIEKEKSNHSSLTEEINRTLKNLELKKEAHLIDETEYKQLKKSLSNELQEIKENHECILIGCKKQKSPASNYCITHRCKTPGCKNCVDTLGNDLPVAFDSILRTVFSVAGNANSDHIMKTTYSFCHEHGAELRKNQFTADAEKITSEGKWSEPKKDSNHQPTSLKFYLTTSILAGIFILAYLYIA